MPCVYNFWVLCVFNACHCLARDRFFVHSFLFSAAIYTTENNLSIHYFVEATVVCHFARRIVDVENSVLQQSYLFLSVNLSRFLVVVIATLIMRSTRPVYPMRTLTI